MKRTSALAPLEDACTVVLLRDGNAGLETLMLERTQTSRAFSGAWVFPGGKVDLADRLAPDGTVLHDCAAATAAGLRELAEETGQRLEPGDLVWLSQWTPLQDIPRRFQTWFMVAAAASTQVVINPLEHLGHLWISPAQALARHARGELKLIPPTWVTLHHLTTMDSTAQALTAAKAAVPFSYRTHLLGSDGVMWSGDEAYPDTTEAGDPGARHRLVTRELPWIFQRSGETERPRPVPARRPWINLQQEPLPPPGSHR